MNTLKNVRTAAKGGFEAALYKSIEKVKAELKSGKAASNISADRIYALNKLTSILQDEAAALSSNRDGEDEFKLIKADFDKRTKQLKKVTDEAGAKLSNMFNFCDEVFGDEQELLIIVTELTVNYHSAHFIARYGCKEYFAHNKALLFYERQKELIQNIGELDL
jgi:hypothetical protein